MFKPNEEKDQWVFQELTRLFPTIKNVCFVSCSELIAGDLLLCRVKPSEQALFMLSKPIIKQINSSISSSKTNDVFLDQFFAITRLLNADNAWQSSSSFVSSENVTSALFLSTITKSTSNVFIDGRTIPMFFTDHGFYIYVVLNDDRHEGFKHVK